MAFGTLGALYCLLGVAPALCRAAVESSLIDKLGALAPAIREKYDWEIECIKLVVEAQATTATQAVATDSSDVAAVDEEAGEGEGGESGVPPPNSSASKAGPGHEDLDEVEEQAVLQSLDTLFEPPAPKPASSPDPAAGGDGRAESKEGAALGLDEGHLSVFYESNV